MLFIAADADSVARACGGYSLAARALFALSVITYYMLDANILWSLRKQSKLYEQTATLPGEVDAVMIRGGPSEGGVISPQHSPHQ